MTASRSEAKNRKTGSRFQAYRGGREGPAPGDVMKEDTLNRAFPESRKGEKKEKER
jgi:hypothetical protein